MTKTEGPLFFVEDADGDWADRSHHDVGNVGKLITDLANGQFSYDGRPPRRVIVLHPDGTWETSQDVLDLAASRSAARAERFEMPGEDRADAIAQREDFERKLSREADQLNRTLAFVEERVR